MSVNGQWTDIEDGASSNDPGPIITITAPDDAGGGLFRVSQSNSAGVIPAMIIQASGDTVGAIISGTAGGTADESTKYGVFQAAPGQSYTVQANQFSVTSADAYPVTHTISYSFESLVDCWEPNDTASDAKLVIPGELIEAYANAGYTVNYEFEYNDWYRVELDTFAKLSA